MDTPWRWMKAEGGVIIRTDPHDELFHAYDINGHCACQPYIGLGSSCQEPNEASRLCEHCVKVVQAIPAGRDLITYPKGMFDAIQEC